jgi:hypothetical protein
MKTANHTCNTVHGEITVELAIFEMDAIDAIDVYEQDPRYFDAGGFRVEGIINGLPAGEHFYAYRYFGEGTEDAARAFLAQAGYFSA